jgi:hypothetical protein
MKSRSIFLILLQTTLLLGLLWTKAWAGSVTLPHSFTAGTPAVAAEVNTNFTAIETEMNDNDSRIAALESALTALQARVSSLEAANSSLEGQVAALENQLATSQVMALESYLRVDLVSDARGPLVELSGVNLQLINGQNSTDTANGLGNLILGYDEANSTGRWFCTLGADPDTHVPISDESSCIAVGAEWTDTGFKSGSHNLVVGSGHNYSRWGGLVAGRNNTIHNDYAGIGGGYNNSASGQYSNVSGGQGNSATGQYANVFGGFHNSASGANSSISGGFLNQARGNSSSISGGNSNTANGAISSISGGRSNDATGSSSSILGGLNQATTTSEQTIPALP